MSSLLFILLLDLDMKDLWRAARPVC